MLKKYQDVEHYMQRSLNLNLFEDDLRFKFILYSIQIRYYTKSLNKEQLLMLAPEVESEYQKYHNQLITETQILFPTAMALMFFNLEEYQKSHYYVKSILSTYTTALRREVLSFAYLFLSVVCHQLDDFDAFENQYRTSRTHFSRHPSPYGFELQFVSVLYRLFHGKVSRTEAFKDSLMYLEHNDIHEELLFILNILDFKNWIKSKQNNKSYWEHKCELAS